MDLPAGLGRAVINATCLLVLFDLNYLSAVSKLSLYPVLVQLRKMSNIHTKYVLLHAHAQET